MSESVGKFILTLGNVVPSIDLHEFLKIGKESLSGSETYPELLDHFIALSAAKFVDHWDYDQLAVRLQLKKLYESTEDTFTEAMKRLEAEAPGILAPKFLEYIEENGPFLNDMIDCEADFKFKYLGLKTLLATHLLKYNLVVYERPQYLFARVAVALNLHSDVCDVKELYLKLKNHELIFASPILFNSGTTIGQLASCFLMDMTSDSIEGIYETLASCAKISKGGAGIGLSISKIRAQGSVITKTMGVSNGIVPMLKVFNSTSQYVDQGGNRRPGAFAIYLEPWHADIEDFLELRGNFGSEGRKARDLFYALWVSDNFMTRVMNDEMWTLFCPKKCPGLDEVSGMKFEELYEKYESEGKGRSIPARTLWRKIMKAQIETGMPFLLFKDTCNQYSPQNHMGQIKTSNLCTEIIQYCREDQPSMCNLANICLVKCVKDKHFSFDKLEDLVRVCVRMLNRCIDNTTYVLEGAKCLNKALRPIGIGVQGLADCLMEMELPFTSEFAKYLNKEIFATMYKTALDESANLAHKEGPYPCFRGSYMNQQKILHCDFWGKEHAIDFSHVRTKVRRYGLRNSVLIAVMPTASTSHILGNCECIEPLHGNVYSLKVLGGEIQVINYRLQKKLIELGLYTSEMKARLMANGGLLSELELPREVKDVFKTVWEIPQMELLQMYIERAPYIDQSESHNLFFATPTYTMLNEYHMAAWRGGVKTGMYYLRSKAAAKAPQTAFDCCM